MKVYRLSDIMDHSPRTMSGRARWYLSAAGGRHFVTGMTLLIAPWLYSSVAFIPIFNTLPLVVWGLIMVAGGIACILGAITRNPTLARLSIAASACITLALAAGLTIGVVASWAAWVGYVSWPVAWNVIVTQPQIYPADLLGLGPAPPSPFLPIVMIAVTVKDFIVCGQPLRVPLEEAMDRYRRRREGA